MKKISKVGRNIMNLAKAINETPTSVAEELGISSGHMSEIKYSDKNPKRQTLEKLASYFGVSVEALMNDDFTGLNLLADPARFSKNIYTLLPLKVSDEALGNPRFAKAYAAQKRCYDAEKNMKPIKSPEEKKKLFEACMAYFEAEDSDEVSEEWAVNSVSLYYYFLLCLKTSEVVSRYVYHDEHYPAVIEKMKENNPDFREMIELIEFNDDLQDGTPFQDAVRDKDFEEIISDFLLSLKSMDGYQDLAEYYLCLLYIFGAAANNFTEEQNNEFGTDLMFRYAAMENEYAKNYVRIMAPEFR